MKQETLEEAAERYSDRTEEYVLKCRISKESISHLGLYLGFIEGSKWQQEKMYSEEEVIVILTERCKHFGTSVSRFNKLLLKQDLEWFEQFKKK